MILPAALLLQASLAETVERALREDDQQLRKADFAFVDLKVK